MGRDIAPNHAAVLLEERLGRVGAQIAGHGRDIVVQQTTIEQLADQEGHAAGGVEMVHVGLAVGIDAGEQRRHLGKLGEIVPGERDAGRVRHRDQVDRVVGRPTGRVQADDAVDEDALVEHAADRRVAVAGGRQRERTACRLLGQRVAQLGAGVDEGGAGQMQAHDLHQHLVGVRRTVEGAGAGAVVGAHLGLQQLVAADLALGVELADVALLGVRDAAGHRACRHEDRRQVAERQRADHEAGHDLVADAEIDRGVERLVRERHRRRQRDHVAREQRQLHARLALGDAVAHGRHAARDLRRGACGAGRAADHLRVGLVGLMGGEHVVIGGDDAEVGRAPHREPRLVVRRRGGEGVRLVGAAELGPRRLRLVCGGFEAVEVAAARVVAARHDPLSDLGDAGVNGHVQSLSSRGFRRREAPSSAWRAR